MPPWAGALSFEETLGAAGNGDEEAFAAIWRWFHPSLVRYLRIVAPVEAELRLRHRIAGTVWGTYHPARVMRHVEWGEVDRCDAVILTHGD